MANTAGVIAAFATGDAALMRRSLHDHFAEPKRAPLIQNFDRVKKSALAAGALGCSISGAGPTLFALSSDLASAQASAEAMRAAFAPVGSEAHVGLVDQLGARVVSGASIA
jgi:homoserine kinase